MHNRIVHASEGNVQESSLAHITSLASAKALDLPSLKLSLPAEPWKNLEETLKRWSSSTEEQVSLAELPAALDNTLMVPRSGLQHAGVTSYGYKLQCLWTQVRQIARERDEARLSLEKAERHCLQLGRELDEQYIALEHTQSKLRDFQAEIEAKELLLQQAVSHQAKLEADARFLQGKEASLQGRLNHVIKENTQLQNKVTEMSEKLSASEEMVLELQKELNHIVEDKLGQVGPHSPEFLQQSERFAEIVLEYERQCQVLYDQNGALRRELQRLRLQLQDSRAEGGLPAREMSLPVEQLQEQLQDLKVQLETKINYYEEEIKLMRKNFERERKESEESFKAEMRKMEDQKRDLEETVAKYCAVINSLKEQKCAWSLELEERFEMEQARVGQHHTEDICHPGQQLDQDREELKTQHRDRLSLRKHVSDLGREKVEELAEITELTALSEKGKEELSHLNVRMHQLGWELPEHRAGHSDGLGTAQRLVEAEWLPGAEIAARLEHHQKHAACWMEMELLQQQLKASQEKAGWAEGMEAEWRWLTQGCQELWFPMAQLAEELEQWEDQLLEAKASLSLARSQHALQLQQAKAQINNMVPKKQFEQLQTTLREEQGKTQQLQESLQQQAEQMCRQLVRTQEEHEHLLQAAVEQAEGLEHSLRGAEAVLAERVAQLRDAQAQLSKNKILIEDLRGENRSFAMALQAAELKQKSMEEKNQLLEEQASALKQLIGKITPASLSG